MTNGEPRCDSMPSNSGSKYRGLSARGRICRGAWGSTLPGSPVSDVFDGGAELGGVSAGVEDPSGGEYGTVGVVVTGGCKDSGVSSDGAGEASVDGSEVGSGSGVGVGVSVGGSGVGSGSGVGVEVGGSG